MTTDAVIILCNPLDGLMSIEFPGLSPGLSKSRHFRLDGSTVTHLNCESNFLHVILKILHKGLCLYTHWESDNNCIVVC